MLTSTSKMFSNLLKYNPKWNKSSVKAYLFQNNHVSRIGCLFDPGLYVCKCVIRTYGCVLELRNKINKQMGNR